MDEDTSLNWLMALAVLLGLVGSGVSIWAIITLVSWVVTK